MKDMEIRLPDYEEIPDVGLFLEQVSKYINSFTGPLFNVELTGSMISNYVKMGLIESPVKKQYNRDQIAHLFFISLAKSVLSLDDINSLIQIQKQNYETKRAYTYFVEETRRAIESVFLGIKQEESSQHEPFEKVLLQNTVKVFSLKAYLGYCFQLLKQDS